MEQISENKESVSENKEPVSENKEPVKGKGIRRLFRDNGYKLYLVDEFSKCTEYLIKNKYTNEGNILILEM
jgi:hypothetical protein